MVGTRTTVMVVAAMAKTRSVAETVLGVAGEIVVENGTVERPFGQIVQHIVCGKIFLFQCGIGHAQARRVVQTFDKHVAEIFSLGKRNGPPTKQRRQCMNGGFAFASTPGWASNAVPIVVVAGRVVEVLGVATIGGGGPRWFGTGGLLCIGLETGRTGLARQLSTGILVLILGALHALVKQ